MADDLYWPLKQIVTVTETVLTDTKIVPNNVKSSVLNFLKIVQGSFADTRREPDGHDFDEIYSSKALSQNCEKWPLNSCLSILLVRMEQLGSYLTDFCEIWYLSIFRTTVEKIQVSLKSDKDNGYFTLRSIYIFDHISLSSA